LSGRIYTTLPTVLLIDYKISVLLLLLGELDKWRNIGDSKANLILIRKPLSSRLRICNGIELNIYILCVIGQKPIYFHDKTVSKIPKPHN